MYAQDWDGKAPTGTEQYGYRHGANVQTTKDGEGKNIDLPMRINLGQLCWDYIPEGSAKVLFCPHRLDGFYPNRKGNPYYTTLGYWGHGGSGLDYESFFDAWDAGRAHVGYAYRIPDREGSTSYVLFQQTLDVYRDRKKCIVADIYFCNRQWEAHQGRLNLLFLDGHVKTTSVEVPSAGTASADHYTETTFETYFDPEY